MRTAQAGNALGQPLVVTRDESGQVELGGPATRIVPGWQFLLENDAAE